MQIILYYMPRTRATRVRWLLEELELPYQLVKLDLLNGEGQSERYKKLHPLGCVPAVDIDGNVMIESGAICEWLADQYPEKRLAPPVTAPERMQYTQWMYFVSATLEAQAWNLVLHSRLLPEERRVKQVIPWSRRKYDDGLAVINDQLKSNEYLLGQQFTTADILLTNLLGWLPDQVRPFAHTYNYMKKIMQREKYQLAVS